MIFDPELYFYGLGENKGDIQKYNSRFNEGILICPQILLYLVLGSYAKKFKGHDKSIYLSDQDKLSYLSIVRLLSRISGGSGKLTKLYITPHIFTKFIHLLKLRDKPGKHFAPILDLIGEDMGYVIEEDIRKEELMELDNFRNNILGVSESALIILKDKKNPPCILTTNPKILNSYDNKFLHIDFDRLMSFIAEDDRRNKIK